MCIFTFAHFCVCGNLSLCISQLAQFYISAFFCVRIFLIALFPVCKPPVFKSPVIKLPLCTNYLWIKHKTSLWSYNVWVRHLWWNQLRSKHICVYNRKTLNFMFLWILENLATFIHLLKYKGMGMKYIFLSIHTDIHKLKRTSNNTHTSP